MSLIGTMYKEPRVFAHDAYALSQLKSEYGVVFAAALTIQSDGTNYFCANGATDVRTQGGSGSGLTVDLTVDPLTGGVTAAAVNQQGSGYLPGDVVTFDAECGQNTADAVITALNLGPAVAWAVGDPLTIMPGPKTDISFYREKTQYSYTFGGVNFVNPGPPAALYIGVDTSITVIMEASNNVFDGTTKEVEIPGLKAGTVLPFSVLTITDLGDATLDDIIALW